MMHALFTEPCRWCDWCYIKNVSIPHVCYDFDSLDGLILRDVDHVQTLASKNLHICFAAS